MTSRDRVAERWSLRNESFLEELELLDNEVEEDLFGVQHAIVDAQVDQLAQQVQHVLLHVHAARDGVQLPSNSTRNDLKLI